MTARPAGIAVVGRSPADAVGEGNGRTEPTVGHGRTERQNGSRATAQPQPIR